MPTTQFQGSYGWATVLGFAKEATYGTAVAPTAYLPAVSDQITYTNKLVPRMGVRATKGQTLSNPGQVDVKGSFEIECEPDTVGQILAVALGTDSVSGSGAYTHTLKLASPLPSITLSADYGYTSVHEWVGCKVDTLDLTSKAGGMLQAKFGIMAQSDVILASSALSPVYGTNLPYDFQQITAATLNGVGVALDSFSISLKNNLAPYFSSGSGRLVRNINEKNAQVTGSFTLAYESDTIANLALNATNVPLSITFTSASSAYLSTPYSLTITCPNIIMQAAPLDPKRNDVVMYNVKFTAHESATGAQDDLKISVVNTISSAMAP